MFKSFLGSKGNRANNNMIRIEVNDKKKKTRTVADGFAEYFSNMADLEGTAIQVTEAEHVRHESSLQIKVHVDDRELFVYQTLTEDKVYNTVKKIDLKKSIGWDKMPPEVIRLSAESIIQSLTNV